MVISFESSRIVFSVYERSWVAKLKKFVGFLFYSRPYLEHLGRESRSPPPLGPNPSSPHPFSLSPSFSLLLSNTHTHTHTLTYTHTHTHTHLTYILRHSSIHHYFEMLTIPVLSILQEQNEQSSALH